MFKEPHDQLTVQSAIRIHVETSNEISQSPVNLVKILGIVVEDGPGEHSDLGQFSAQDGQDLFGLGHSYSKFFTIRFPWRTGVIRSSSNGFEM